MKASKTSNVHIGFERYAAITKVAIDVSYQTGKQITASQVAQYLIDNHLESSARVMASKQPEQMHAVKEVKVTEGD